MDNRDFELLVERVERASRAHPGMYKAQVFALAVLGYVFLAVVIAVLAAVVGIALLATRRRPVVAVKLALVIVPFSFVVVRALWVRMEAPEGWILTRRDTPELFILLDQLRYGLRTPSLHAALVTSEFNAAVVQVPRLGLFGWRRNYLLLGLPVLLVLTREQLVAILSHELGHLCHEHWIYRLRLMWLRLNEALIHSAPPGSQLVSWFYEWYVPYFAAFSFPLARANEFSADEAAARLTSPQVLSQALSNLSVVGAFLSERYWPDIYKAAADAAPQTAFTPFSKLGATVLTGIPESDCKRWLSAGLSQTASFADTHPSLQERIHVMGGTPEVAMPVPGQAADVLFQPVLPRLLTQFDRQWDKRLAQWREQQPGKDNRLANIRLG